MLRMQKSFHALFLSAVMLAGSLCAGSALAADVKVGALQLSAPWARATPKGAKVAGGYLKITNTGGEADRLIGGSTSAADRVEIHEMSMRDGIMRMRQLANGLEIKPGKTVDLTPGGLHVMFVNLKRPLPEGEHLKVTLVFAKAGKVEVDFFVAGIGAQNPGGRAGHSMPGGMKH